MIACTFLMALRASMIRLVDGPHDGKRQSDLRGQLACEGGEYRHVLGGDPLALYWIPHPVILSPKREAAAEIADNPCPKTTPDYTR